MLMNERTALKNEASAPGPVPEDFGLLQFQTGDKRQEVQHIGRVAIIAGFCWILKPAIEPISLGR